MKNARILTKSERDFLVCSDCAHFNFTELIDVNYPQIRRGICSLHNKIVDNRWETLCEDNTGQFTCKDCIYCTEDEIFDEDGGVSWIGDICGCRGGEIDINDDACEDFSEK
jgi:hypothetical protein